MHYWGDEWFQKNGNDLNNAIDFIETYLRKHHIGVCGKEKYGCYDESTEVLTKTGWKSFKYLTFDDEIATLKNGKYLEYQKPVDIMKYDFDGKMYHLKNRGVDIFVTDNHNLYISKGSYTGRSKKKHEYDFELAKPDKYYRLDKRFKKGCIWIGVPKSEFNIDPETKFDICKRKSGTVYERKHDYPGFTCNIETFLKFLGFYVAGGYVHETAVYIAHNHLTETEFVSDLIKNIGEIPHLSSANLNMQYFNNPQLSRWLPENCGKRAYCKKVPEFVKELPPEYIKIFLEYLYKGDGHKNKSSHILTTTSKQLADDVCELLIKCGDTFKMTTLNRVGKQSILKGTGKVITAKHIVYEVSWLKNTEVEIEMSKVNKSLIKSYVEEYIPFRGFVYCATVPNHIMYVRRNGKGYWCGNSYRDEYLHFWGGGLYEILFGYSVYIGTWRFKNYPKLQSLINKIHHFIYYKVDCGTPEKRENESFEEYSIRFKNRKWKGLQHYSSQIGLTKWIHDHQAKHYNKAFQLACKKWPNVKDELIVMVDGYKMIKPCRWGNVDGEEIHNKYWKKL
jgi:hypothetical protein